MDYLADTVAIVRHLRRHPDLGQQARRILTEADQGQHHVYISAIALMEVLYLAQARRISVGLHDLMQVIDGSQNYTTIW